MPKQVLAEPEGVDTFSGTEDEDFIPTPIVRQPIADPQMDPAHISWNPKKYFGAQDKEIILIQRDTSDMLGDPTGTKTITVPVSINGYRLTIQKGIPTRVPKDFADMLVARKMAIRYDNVALASEV